MGDNLQVDDILRAVRDWPDYNVKTGDLYKGVQLSGSDLILVAPLVGKDCQFYVWVDKWHAEARDSDIAPLFERFT